MRLETRDDHLVKEGVEDAPDEGTEGEGRFLGDGREYEVVGYEGHQRAFSVMLN